MDLHSGLKIKAFPHCITLPVQLFALGLVPMPPEEKSCFFKKLKSYVQIAFLLFAYCVKLEK